MNAHPLRRLGAIAVVAIALASPAHGQDAGSSPPGSAPAGRYTYPAAGTVYDTKTKLTWQQTVPSATYAWADAKTYCAGVGATLSGTGWRLPTMKELQTIVDELRRNPAVDPTAFPGTPSNFFWSSSPATFTVSPTLGWYVNFSLGESRYFNPTASFHVRCVR